MLQLKSSGPLSGLSICYIELKCISLTRICVFIKLATRKQEVSETIFPTIGFCCTRKVTSLSNTYLCASKLVAKPIFISKCCSFRRLRHTPQLSANNSVHNWNTSGVHVYSCNYKANYPFLRRYSVSS